MKTKISRNFFINRHVRKNEAKRDSSLSRNQLSNFWMTNHPEAMAHVFRSTLYIYYSVLWCTGVYMKAELTLRNINVNSHCNKTDKTNCFTVEHLTT